MTRLTPLTLLGAMLLAACDNADKSHAPPPAAPAPSALYQTPGVSWPEGDFTPWMSRAELQIAQEKDEPAGHYFAHVEGRSNCGRCEYRAIRRPFPADRFDQWAVFWGLREDELFDWELRLLKNGFIRHDMQLFANSRGEAVHQIVWLKPIGAGGSEPPGPDASVAVAGNTPPPPAPDPSVAAVAGPQPVMVPPPPPSEDGGAPPHAVPVGEPPSGGSRYSVVAGDTLARIARRKGTTVKAIKAANHLKNDALRIGQKLIIPAKTAPGSNPTR